MSADAERRGLARLRPGRRTLRRAGVLALGGFVVGYVVTALLFFGGGPRAAVITVPDLRTLTSARARRLVERQDLVLEITDSLPNARIARGAVVAQTPLPGREVAPETPVRVILSQGRERRPVPRVDAYPRRQAERILLATGFSVIVHAVASRERAGRVVGTMPDAGGTVPIPGTVRLLISAGPPLVSVPALVGLARADAEAAVLQAGLEVGGVVTELRPELAEGVVVSQNPSPGDSIRAGSGVDLSVATHQPPSEPEPPLELQGEELEESEPPASGAL